jgi:hypothetical protein
MTDKDKEILELKRQVEEWKEGSKAWREEALKGKNQLAAKEKECKEWKKGVIEGHRIYIELQDENKKLKAAHDAEMCAFAEYLADKCLIRIVNDQIVWMLKDDIYYDMTTTELLNQFRDEKH